MVVVGVEDVGLVCHVVGSFCDGLLPDFVECGDQLVQRGSGIVALEPDGFSVVGIAGAVEVLFLTRVDWSGIVRIYNVELNGGVLSVCVTY